MTQVSMPDTLAFNQFVDQPFQTTLCDRVLFDGIGLHSGRFVELSICPAPANSGIKFNRIDIDTKRQTVEAHARFAEEARLCTRIVNVDGIGLETIEHMMAAFAGVGLDNAVVEINAPEAPILDGSSQPFVDAIKSVGLKLLPVRRKHIIVTKSVMVGLDNGAWARLDPSKHLEINIKITFDDAAIGNQTLTYRHSDGSFAAELARARTFCQLRDVQLMKNAGLALGGSLDNAIVVDDGKILNDGGLRMEREFVRHKALDCLGDLLLLGLPVKAKMTAYRPGHALSTKLAQKLLKDQSAFKVVEAGTTQTRSDSYALPEFAAAATA
ncbi:MAG: UDP-3-O-acyl-N-acetylglucosamine deacetylase [Pseudomonadota bacterium]|nr:UDP-3-O-acyl-N-acetylglucosamine deacetylase [Pseudomonadota bacterium]